MSADLDQMISPVAARDAYLCFCEQITADAVRARIAEEPDISFETLCAETGLGSKCTACLLNAETLFAKADRSRPGSGRSARRRTPHGDRWSRQRLYRLIDALSPRMARTVPGIIPIIAGPGISTTLAFANVIPPVIGDRAPPFDVRVAARDAEGRIVARHAGCVARDGRLEFDISAALVANGDELVTGACFLSYRATESGYLGCIRPHFKVRTPCAVTSVHSAGAGRADTFLETCLLNRDERQFVSAVNCTDRAARIATHLSVDGAHITLADVTVPPRGARLIEVAHPRLPAEARFAVHARSDREVRWHYLVAEGRPPRISLDHI